MELFIVAYQGGVLLPRNVIDGLQTLESNKYHVELDPGRRELVSTCEKLKVLHKIIINLHQTLEDREDLWSKFVDDFW